MTTITKLKAALAALETSQQFVEASSNAKLHHGWGNQLDEAEAAIFDLKAVIAEMEAGEYQGRPCKVGGDCVAGKTTTCACLEMSAIAQPKAEAVLEPSDVIDLKVVQT